MKMSEINKIKRSRTSNFTSEEKLLLLQIIQKYKNVIENKTSGTTTWKDKEKVWKKIETEFNSSTTIFRSIEVLKRFYNNQKKQTRKQAATDRMQVSGTGGGPYLGVTNDPVFNLTMSIINKKSVYGLSNKHDDDNISHSENTGFRIEPLPSCSTWTHDDVIIEDYTLPTATDDYPPPNEVDDYPPPTETDDYPPPTETDDPPPPTEVDDYPPPPERAEIRRSSNRRRPQTSMLGNVAVKYEEVAELKKEVFSLQRDYLMASKQGLQETLEWENNQRRLEESRKLEEHDLKMKALQLDIEIKEAQLEALKKCAN